MKLPTLFKQNKNKSFSYTPRYYNPRKERLELLVKKQEAADLPPAGMVSRASGRRSFRADWRAQKNQTESKNRRSRLFFTFVFLVLFFLALVKTGVLNWVV